MMNICSFMVLFSMDKIAYFLLTTLIENHTELCYYWSIMLSIANLHSSLILGNCNGMKLFLVCCNSLHSDSSRKYFVLILTYFLSMILFSSTDYSVHTKLKALSFIINSYFLILGKFPPEKFPPEGSTPVYSPKECSPPTCFPPRNIPPRNIPPR